MVWNPKHIGVLTIAVVIAYSGISSVAWSEDRKTCPALNEILKLSDPPSSPEAAGTSGTIDEPGKGIVVSVDEGKVPAGPIEQPKILEAPEVPATAARIEIGAGAVDRGKAEMKPATPANALKTANKAGGIFRLEPTAKWKNWVTQRATAIRNYVRVKQDHTYPIIAIDDATPVHAHALAADAFQNLAEDQKALVNIEMIKADLFETLKSVENYKTNLDQFVNDSASKTAQIEALEFWLKTNRDARNFTLEVPVLRVEEGKLVEASERLIFPDDAAVRIKINELKRDLHNRLGLKWNLKPNDAHKLAIDQAIKIKRLETFRSELHRQELLNKDPAKGLPDDLRDALKRINALYERGNRDQVIQDLRPPIWAEERLRILQAGAEVKTYLFKAAPSKLEKAEQNKIVQFVKNLKPEDKQALGITKFANAAGILSRSTWFTRISGTLAATGGVGTPLYELFFSERAMREKCASAPTENDFVVCVRDYLMSKFAGRYALSELEKFDLINAEGQLGDPRMIKEVNKLKLLRTRYLKAQNKTDELDDATRITLEANGVSEEQLRAELVETKADTDFRTKIVAPNSYFAQKFPSFFKNVKNLMEQAAGVQYGSEQYYDITREMRRKAPRLTDEFDRVMDERDRYRLFGGAPSDSYDDYDFPMPNRGSGQVPRMTRRGSGQRQGPSLPIPYGNRRQLPNPGPGIPNSDGTIPIPQGQIR